MAVRTFPASLLWSHGVDIDDYGDLCISEFYTATVLASICAVEVTRVVKLVQ